MKQFKLVVSLFVSASLLVPVTYARSLMKDEINPVAATAPYNWTGLYLGLNAGFVQHTMNITDQQATTFNATIQQTTNPHFTGGFQVGYRRQLDLSQVSGVYGVEFSADFANATFSKQYGSPTATYQLDSNNELNSLCLLELIGGIAADRTLLFLTAGLSWTDISGTTTNVSSIPFFNSFNVSKNPMGTALGGGVEYAFNDKFSARFKVDVITPNSYSTNNNTGDTFQISNSIVQGTFGVNYKFA
jgi:outer membrane immunogenic protein